MQHAPGFLKIVEDAKSRVREISVSETRKKLESRHVFQFVDVREDNEWQQGRAAGAVHLGKGVIERDIEAKISDHDSEIILYCGGGFRSALAADALQKMGYTNVYSMAGGYKEWLKQQGPVVKG